MNITKTTHNFAAKRNLELVINDDSVCFYDMKDDGEPCVIYSISELEGLFYKGNIWLSKSTKEELPQWIKGEKHLRETIDFLSKELA